MGNFQRVIRKRHLSNCLRPKKIFAKALPDNVTSAIFNQQRLGVYTAINPIAIRSLPAAIPNGFTLKK